MGEVRSKREAYVGNEWGGIERGTGVRQDAQVCKIGIEAKGRYR